MDAQTLAWARAIFRGVTVTPCDPRDAKTAEILTAVLRSRANDPNVVAETAAQLECGIQEIINESLGPQESVIIPQPDHRNGACSPRRTRN